MGQQLPVDPADYLRVVPATWTPLFGMHFPLTAADMVAESAMRVRISDDILRDVDEPGVEAGAPEHRFCNAFLGLTSDGCGNALFVDLRQGALHGRITEWDEVDGSYSPEPREWSGVAPLLEDLLASLTSARPFASYFVPATRDGLLRWDWYQS